MGTLYHGLTSRIVRYAYGMLYAKFSAKGGKSFGCICRPIICLITLRNTPSSKGLQKMGNNIPNFFSSMGRGKKNSWERHKHKVERILCDLHGPPRR